MRRLIWKFFRGQIRSSKKKPRPRVLGRGLGSFWRNLFRSSAYYLRGFALLFKQKICCLKAKQMLQKYHSGREKAWLPPRMGVVGVRFSSNSRQEAALLRVVVFTIFKQLYGGTTMKQLLMCSAAIALGLAVAAPAKADGIKLDLAGHFNGYVTWLSQDTIPGTNERDFDILRETEIHFTGETTLDNGLTVGVHHEADIDQQKQDWAAPASFDTFLTEESYAYFSGAWGRVNFGKEDGANYLLKVAAPSADENFDGLRQYINPVNYLLTNAIALHTYEVVPGTLPFLPLTSVASQGRGFANTGKLDYANDATGYSNKFTYLTPVFSGFQAGFSYTPNVGYALQPGGISSGTDGSSAFGVHANDIAGLYGSAWEGSGRYEGQWQNVGITLGGGYTRVNLESSADPLRNYDQWNLGADRSEEHTSELQSRQYL